MSTIAFQPGGRLRVRGLAERNVFLYVVRGALQVGMAEDRVSAFHLVELGHEGDEVEMTALEDAFILFGHAEPIGAPLVSHGPFVMNSRAEIEQAIRDYQAGKFGQPM
jgi:redox-sensitive bicupin YhaK (pirin superfamily)